MWNQSIYQRLCTNRLSLSLWRSHTFCFANATVLNASKHEAWNLKISSSWRFIVLPPAGKRTWQLPDKDDLKEMTSNLARSVRVKVMQPPIRHMRDCLNEIDSRHLSEVLNSSGKRSPSSKVEKKTWENWNGSNHVCGFLVSTPLISDPSLSLPYIPLLLSLLHLRVT